MRFFVLLLALWFAPVSFQDDSDEPASVSAAERGGCPGGICPRPRPRPRPTR